jgi:hypothetical protein
MPGVPDAGRDVAAAEQEVAHREVIILLHPRPARNSPAPRRVSISNARAGAVCWGTRSFKSIFTHNTLYYNLGLSVSDLLWRIYVVIPNIYSYSYSNCSMSPSIRKCACQKIPVLSPVHLSTPAAQLIR